MKNGDTVAVSRKKEQNPNLNFLFMDKKGDKRELVTVATRDEVYKDIPDFLRQTWDCAKGQVHNYKNFRNDVMRPTDGSRRKNWHMMSFEETVSTRPVILKRINSLFENLGEELTNC